LSFYVIKVGLNRLTVESSMRMYGMVRSVAIGTMVLLALMCVEAHAQRKNSGAAELSGVVKAGQTQVNSKDGLTYVWIPPGTFMMGCSPLYSECYGNEKPAHSVTITKGFWMGQTPVTQAAFQRVKGFNPSRFRGDQMPVEQVTWFAASDYCSAVGLRLPTEAEWEYAARAGSPALTYGDIDSIAWYARNSGNQTHDVAQKQPNAWKLYDMLGNVLQWTADWYDQNYYSQSPSQDPRGPLSGKGRVVRGTAWYIDGGVRVPGRSPSEPGYRNGPYGFRCAGEGDMPTSSPISMQ
jgi:formylglycine-generating enzyme required for sulfatase activity